MSRTPRPLPALPLRKQLEPFATIFFEILVPEAVAGEHYVYNPLARRRGPLPKKELQRISRRIAAAVADVFGRPLHRMFTLCALHVVNSYFRAAVMTKHKTKRLTKILELTWNLIMLLYFYYDPQGICPFYY